MSELEQDKPDNVVDLPIKMDHANIEFKVNDFKADEKDFFEIEGYGSTFGNVDLGEDIIVRGAFTKSLHNRKPKLLFQHDMDRPLGVIDVAQETDRGLFIKARMPKKSALAQEVFSMLEIGALDSFSIGFSVKEQNFRKDGVREIKEVELFEVSVVTIPMNPKAMVTGVKSFTVEDVEDVHTKRDLERLLVSTGAVSKKAAVLLSSRFEPKQSESDKVKKQSESVKEKADIKATEEMVSFVDELNNLVRSLSHE